jgi:hypothetical protein
MGTTRTTIAGIPIPEPETAFGTMYTDILEETVPGYVRPNFCDYIRGSRFDA